MNEEEKNREIRIKQQKGSLIRNIIICISILLVLSLVFWLVTKNARGTEIEYTDYLGQYESGNIEKVYVKQDSGLL